MLHKLHFQPLPGLSGPHQQTLVGWTCSLPVYLPSVTVPVLLPDNDQIALEVSTPADWKATDPTALIIHGLCGSHRSPMVARVAKRLHDKGWRTARMNMRGSGSGRLLARQIYHSGQSEDIGPVLTKLHGDHPHSPITLIAFSLGGNVALKFAGENPEQASKHLTHLITACPPTDLLASCRMFMLPQNQIYQRHFLKELIEDLKERERLYPDLPRVHFPKNLTLFEFDQLFTAPQAGFDGAIDYYSKVSSAQYVPDITVPTKILYAADDPFIDWTALNGLSLPSNIDIRLTRHGGHMGFLGIPGSHGGLRWLDTQLTEWTVRGP